MEAKSKLEVFINTCKLLSLNPKNIDEISMFVHRDVGLEMNVRYQFPASDQSKTGEEDHGIL